MPIKQKDIDLGFGKIVKNVEALRGKRVSVQYGVLKGGKASEKAAKFEHGGFYDGKWGGYVPPRPIFAPEYEKNLTIYEEAGHHFNDAVISGKDPMGVARDTGMKGKTNIMRRIDSLNYDPSIPKLHPATIKKKGHDKIGKDTGDMIASVAYSVKVKNKNTEDEI